MSLENKLEQKIEREEKPEQLSLRDRIKYGSINWAIDTSAKTGTYVPLMGAMEAYNGLDIEQIFQSRASAALVDVGLARIYTKTADYLGKKFDVDIKDGSPKAWGLDALAMIGTHAPVYAGILVATGADAKQIGYASLMGAIIGLSTSKPFRKFVLAPWRKFWGYKK
ncbi:MAG: L-alanine exporter AlaE [Nanoarchaeota archaeon]